MADTEYKPQGNRFPLTGWRCREKHPIRLGVLGAYFFWMEARKMACKYWECVKTDSEEACQEVDGECLGDMCEDFMECRSCRKQDGEDRPEY